MKRDTILKLTGASLVPLLWAASLGSAAAQGAARTPRTFNSTVTHTGPADSGNWMTGVICPISWSVKGVSEAPKSTVPDFTC